MLVAGLPGFGDGGLGFGEPAPVAVAFEQGVPGGGKPGGHLGSAVGERVGRVVAMNQVSIGVTFGGVLDADERAGQGFFRPQLMGFGGQRMSRSWRSV